MIKLNFMNQNLKGKILLLLGHPVGALDIVNYAKENGVYTIVADWHETTPAKEAADEAHQISTSDINSLIKLAKEKKVDAVSGGVSDYNFRIAMEISESLGLPFYATRKQWELTSNKQLFKELCRKFDIPVIEEFPIDSTFRQEDLNKIAYPVFIKPVDSAASKGASICSNEEELKKGYQNALDNSISKTVLVEKYIEKMMDINLYYTVQDGEYSIAAMCDRYLTYEQGEKYPPLPIAYIFPSQYLNHYIEKHHKKVVAMCQSIGITNGRFDFCGFTNGEEFYFYEMSYRLGGTQEWIMTEHVNNTNVMKLMINHALTGKMAETRVSKLNKPHFKYPCCELKFPVKPGIVQIVEGLEEINKMPEVIRIHFRRNIGERIELTGTLHQILLGIHICAKDHTALRDSIFKINNILKIFSDDGNDMRLAHFNY